MFGLILSVIALGAVPAPHLAPTIELRVADMRATDDRDVVSEACALLRVHCDVERVGLDYGPAAGEIVILLTDAGPMPWDGGWIVGLTVGGGSCSPALWSDSDGVVLAHELGHALGLDHVGSPDRLMHPQVGTWVTQDELDTVAHQAWELGACL